MTLALRFAARSDRGLIRSNNQDSVYAGPRLLAVADGMGGHAAGDVASKVVIAALAPLDEDYPKGDLLVSLRDATQSANDHLRELIEADANLQGMGTTLTALLFAGNRLGLAHAGDSRCYLLRNGQLSQITHDHTLVQALVDEGRLTPEEAINHPKRSLILRALTGDDVEPDLSVREARVGDRYLLCTDGLSGVVTAETLLDTLRIEDPQECADRLVELALRGGGPDNVTCIVADVIDVEYGDDAPVVAGAAGGNRGREEIAPTSPAARAAGLGASREDDKDDPPPEPDKRGIRPRTLIISFVAVVLLVGVMGALWGWTRSQYFVKGHDDQIVIYRGIDTQIGPLRLYSENQTSDLHVSDLQEVARDQVRRGIAANDQNGVDGILNNLRNLQLPACPQTQPGQSAPPNPAAPESAQGPTPSSAAAPSPTASAEPTRTAQQTSAPIPGRDCRTVD